MSTAAWGTKVVNTQSSSVTLKDEGLGYEVTFEILHTLTLPRVTVSCLSSLPPTQAVKETARSCLQPLDSTVSIPATHSPQTTPLMVYRVGSEHAKPSTSALGVFSHKVSL